MYRLLLLALSLTSACANSSLTGPCADGLDNDKDGWIDQEDPGCALNNNVSESPNPPLPQCSDGIDNDGDGARDYPADRSCESPDDDDEFGKELPDCSDGKDNDGDGKTDYPEDPGCALPQEDSEKDSCPDGADCPACANGKDDDGDGDVDYPEDKGCSNAADRQEAVPTANECGLQVTLAAIASDGGTAFGEAFTQTPSELEGSCGGRGQETAFKMIVPTRASIHVSTNNPETTLDTVIYLRSTCNDSQTELACNDDANTKQSELFAVLEPGTYFIIVDAVNSAAAGQFFLTTTAYTPPGDQCDASRACEPGYLCRKLLDSAPFETCERPQCEDGLDNDGDGKTDYPFEPGCTDPDDNSETDECPNGTDCPQCGNGIDDDQSGDADYPGDPSCTAASDPLEISCTIESDPIVIHSKPTISGSTAQATDDFLPACNTFSTAPDVVHAFNVPGELEVLQVDTFGSSFTNIVSIKSASCTATDLACERRFTSTKTVMELHDVAKGPYVAIVDGYSSGQGNYLLNIYGEVKPGETCSAQAETIGMFPCVLGYSCQQGTCQLAICNDGLDQDGDGLFDYPNDPGCDSPSDTDEQDDCPAGPNCPACGNNNDDDGDGKTDFNLASGDIGCVSAADTSETDECIAGVTYTQLTTNGVSGVTGTVSNFTPSCHSSTTSGEDVYAYVLNQDLETLTFTTEGSEGDTVLSARYQACGDPAAEVACNHVASSGEAIELSKPAHGTYFVFVDGDFLDGVDYELNVRGTLPAGASCSNGDKSFVCHQGLKCDNSVCVETACNDGADNDGDGKTDFPNEPGCESISDDSEADDCPNGANCPDCGNNADDDGDTIADFAGADPGCVSANDDLEVDDCVVGQDVKRLTDAGTSGDTGPSANGTFLNSSCNTSNNYPEDVYYYELDRVLTSITFTTEGSVDDTVTSVRFGQCGDRAAEVGCNNVQNGGEPVTIDQPALGGYYVLVDGDFIQNAEYVLNVRGRLPLGATCDASDQQFTCQEGSKCQASKCVATACNDGADNDGDGNVDFPNEPGCESPADDDETDDCPSGPNCPACGNGVDDDGDNLADFGNDSGCSSANDFLEIDDCVPGLPVRYLPPTGISGRTPVSGSKVRGMCNSSTTATEDAYALEVTRNLATLTISTEGSTGNTVTHVRYDVCDADTNEVGCENDSGGEEVVLVSPPVGTYYIFVDGSWVTNIPYQLSYRGEVAIGGTCDASDAQFPCQAGSRCVASICTPTKCNDGIDNDGDGHADFPDDPGCFTIEDDDEADSCPNGADCPACFNNNDDDGDGDTDFGMDNGCGFPSDVSEASCATTDPVIDLRAGVATGDTTGSSNDFAPACRATSNSPEHVYTFVSPGDLATLTVSTVGSSFDTVLYIRRDDCASAEIACEDDNEGLRETIALIDQPAGEYFIFVDGDRVNDAPYTLTVSGTYKSGATCNPQLSFVSCPQGESCSANGSSFMCQ